MNLMQDYQRIFLLILATSLLCLNIIDGFSVPPHRNTPQGRDDLIIYPGMIPYHQIGSVYEEKAWRVTINDTSNRYMTFGPYTTQWVAVTGPSRVDFLLGIDNNSADEIPVVQIDVNDAKDSKILAIRNISRTDFDYANFKPQVFSLTFTNPSPDSKLEFRVFYRCCSSIVHYKTVVHELMDESTLGDFFHGRASLQFISASNFTTPGHPGTELWNVGTSIKVVDGIWYVFYREMQYSPIPAYCDFDIPLTRTIVRFSKDQGRSWSTNFNVVGNPVPDSESQCAVLDGGSYFDQETNMWHHIAQCIGKSKQWFMCHYYKEGRDPMSGNWVANTANPVVKPGQLWSKICSGSGKHCPSNMHDEGTPEIVDKIDGYYYVTFHGWEENSVKAARGIAKTSDFIHWDVSGFHLPNDAIFTSLDCNHWNISWDPSTGCVGGGEGSIIKSGDYYYQLIEAPDVSLGCITELGKQNWVLGLLRSATLYAKTGEWEQIHENPAFVPWKKIGCSFQYHRLISDGNDFYVSLFIIDFTSNRIVMKVFKIIPGQNQFPIILSPS